MGRGGGKGSGNGAVGWACCVLRVGSAVGWQVSIQLLPDVRACKLRDACRRESLTLGWNVGGGGMSGGVVEGSRGRGAGVPLGPLCPHTALRPTKGPSMDPLRAAVLLTPLTIITSMPRLPLLGRQPTQFLLLTSKQPTITTLRDSTSTNQPFIASNITTCDSPTDKATRRAARLAADLSCCLFTPHHQPTDATHRVDLCS